MELKPVQSSNISHVGYDEATKTLVVKFIKSGRTYKYFPVEPATYRKMIAAPSVGGYHVQHIKNNPLYTYEEITD
jgi:hypothetical protein